MHAHYLDELSGRLLAARSHASHVQVLLGRGKTRYATSATSASSLPPLLPFLPMAPPLSSPSSPKSLLLQRMAATRTTERLLWRSACAARRAIEAGAVIAREDGTGGVRGRRSGGCDELPEQGGGGVQEL